MHWAVVGHLPANPNVPGTPTGPGTPPPPPPDLPPPPPDNPTVSTPWLFYDMPTEAAWAAIGDTRPVAAHYMANWRPAVLDKNVDTDPTAYEVKWQPPGQVEGTVDHRKYGGFTHDWPIGRNPLGATYELRDHEWEVRQAKAAGIRYFYVDLLGADTFKYAQQLAQAAATVGGFKLIPMLDCGASIARNGPVNAANYLMQLFTGVYGDVWLRHTDGRRLVSSYAPETVMERVVTLSGAVAAGATVTALPIKAITFDKIPAGTVFKLNAGGQLVTTSAQVVTGATSLPITSTTVTTAQVANGTLTQQDTSAETTDHWRRWADSMVAQGEPSVLECCFSRAWETAAQNTAPTFSQASLADFVVAFGQWGVGDTVATTAPVTASAVAKTQNTYQKDALYTLRLQGDVRPDQGVFAEGEGFGNLVLAWAVAQSTKPERVQIATWNDWREGTASAPSHRHGWTLLDIVGWYIIRHRLGYSPTVKRPALYLYHRQQQTPTVSPQPAYSANPGIYTKRMVRFGSTPERNIIDVLVAADAPSDLTLTVGGALQTLTYGTTTGTKITVPAGVSRVQAALKPAAANGIVATLKRGTATLATVTSPHPVNYTTQLVQTLDGWIVGSLDTSARPDQAR